MDGARVSSSRIHRGGTWRRGRCSGADARGLPGRRTLGSAMVACPGSSASPGRRPSSRWRAAGQLGGRRRPVLSAVALRVGARVGAGSGPAADAGDTHPARLSLLGPHGSGRGRSLAAGSVESDSAGRRVDARDASLTSGDRSADERRRATPAPRRPDVERAGRSSAARRASLPNACATLRAELTKEWMVGGPGAAHAGNEGKHHHGACHPRG